MTRTEYTNMIRKVGFTVRPLWKGKTEYTEGPRYDLTCYEIHAHTPDGLPGRYVTQMLVRDCETGLDVFFASPSIRAEDDLRFLRDIADRKSAA